MFSLPLSSFLFLVLCLWLSLSLFFLILTHHLHFSISLSCSRAVSYYFYAYPSLPSLPHLPLFLPLPRSLALPPWLPSLFFFLSLALSLSLYNNSTKINYDKKQQEGQRQYHHFLVPADLSPQFLSHEILARLDLSLEHRACPKDQK